METLNYQEHTGIKTLRKYFQKGGQQANPLELFTWVNKGTLSVSLKWVTAQYKDTVVVAFWKDNTPHIYGILWLSADPGRTLRYHDIWSCEPNALVQKITNILTLLRDYRMGKEMTIPDEFRKFFDQIRVNPKKYSTESTDNERRDLLKSIQDTHWERIMQKRYWETPTA